MYVQNPTTQARTIIANSNSVGAKLPAPVLEAYERATRITKAAQSIYPPRDALMVAVIAALDAGQDPAADADVQRAYLAQQIGSSEGIGRGVGDIVAGQMLDVFREHADPIVKAWTKPFDQAAKALAAAQDVLGPVPLTDTTSILALGGNAAEVWAQAQHAAQVLASIDQAWGELAGLTRLATIEQHYPALRIASVDADTWQTQNLHSRKVSAWEALSAGLSLSLPTMQEYRRRIAALQREMAEATVIEQPRDRAGEAISDWAQRTDAARRVSRVATAL
jgi:hypothetical protein